MFNFYSIGQAADKLNCNTSVLRFYEDFFCLDIQRSNSKRRLYTEEEINLFRHIRDMRNGGMTLNQIKNDIDHHEHRALCAETSHENHGMSLVDIHNEISEIKKNLCSNDTFLLREENNALKEKLKQKSLELLQLKEEIAYLKKKKEKRFFK